MQLLINGSMQWKIAWLFGTSAQFIVRRIQIENVRLQIVKIWSFLERNLRKGIVIHQQYIVPTITIVEEADYVWVC